MKKILLSSILLTTILLSEQIKNIPIDKSLLSEENGGSKKAIEAYSDGIGIITNSYGEEQDNTPMNILVYIYGENAKNNGVSLKDYSLNNGNNKEKEMATKLGIVKENIKENGTPCDDGDENTINDMYINGLCVGNKETIENCYIRYMKGERTDGIYTLSNGKKTYCDMTNGGWTLVTLINNIYSTGLTKNASNENLLEEIDNASNQKNYIATFSNREINSMNPKEIMLKKPNTTMIVKTENITGNKIPDYYDYFLNASIYSENQEEINLWLSLNMKINNDSVNLHSVNPNGHYGWTTTLNPQNMLIGSALNPSYKGMCLIRNCWNNRGGAIYVR